MPPSRNTAIVLLPGEGERIGGNLVKAALPELSLLEFDVPPGDSVALHRHEAQSDGFYVLEGEIEFRLGDRTLSAPAGSFVLSPAGLVHGFRNVTATTARLLNIHAPGGFAEYRRELEALRDAGIEPDAAFFEQHDVYDA